MKISGIYIESFGGLKDFRMIFEDGFNLISRKNEAGKSTVMSFIKLMFYSSLDNERSADIGRSIRKKYTPWDGNPMAGTIEFVHEGRRYNVHKVFGKTPSQDEVQCICVETGEKIELAKDEEIGEHFLGLDATSFEKSIFITGFSGNMADDAMPDEIAKRLANAMLSMEEDTCYNDVLNNLSKAMQNLLSKSGKKGVIVDLRQEKKNLEDSLAATEAHIEAQVAAVKERDAVSSELDDLKAKREMRRINRKYTSYLNDRENTCEKHEIAVNAISEYEKNIDPKTMNDLRKKSRVIGVVGFILTALLAASLATTFFLSLVILQLGNNLWTARYAGIGLTAGVFLLFLILYISAKSDYSKEKKRINLVKETVNIEKIKEDDEKLLACIASIDGKLNELDKLCAERESEYIDEYNYMDEDEKLTALIDAASERLINVSSRIAPCPNDPAKLKEQIAAIDEKIAVKQLKYDELNTAMVKLKETVEEIRMGYGDVLNAKTSKIFAELTGGKYTELIVSNDLSISVKDSVGVYRQWKYLSSGTIDQAYLALRLAMSEMMYGQETMPIFMDDMLLEYDNERERNAINYLKKEAGNRQIILFTCKG